MNDFYEALQRFRETKAAAALCLIIVIIGFVVAFMQVVPLAQ